MAKLADVFYIRPVTKDGVTTMEVVKDVKDFVLAVGDKDRVGVYSLQSVLEIKGVLHTTEITNSNS